MPPIRRNRRNRNGLRGCHQDDQRIWTATQACHNPTENAQNRATRVVGLSAANDLADAYAEWRVDNDRLHCGGNKRCICGKPNEHCMVLKNANSARMYIGRTCISYFPGVTPRFTAQGYARDGFVVDDEEDPIEQFDEDEEVEEVKQVEEVEDPIEQFDEDDPEDEADMYIVDRIVDHKVMEGEMRYRVRWLGYAPSEDTWEPRSSFRSSRDLVRAYLKRATGATG